MAMYNKEGALTETGYSSNIVGHDENNMNDWVNCAIPDINAKAASQNTNNPSHPMLFANFYELADECTSGCSGNPLLHFGLLHTDLTPKTCYATFRLRLAAASS